MKEHGTPKSEPTRLKGIFAGLLLGAPASFAAIPIAGRIGESLRPTLNAILSNFGTNYLKAFPIEAATIFGYLAPLLIIPIFSSTKKFKAATYIASVTPLTAFLANVLVQGL